MAPSMHRWEIDTRLSFTPFESFAVQVIADIPPPAAPYFVILYPKNIGLGAVLKCCCPGLIHYKGPFGINQPVSVISGYLLKALPKLFCQVVVTVAPGKALSQVCALNCPSKNGQ